jgi:hypothetical protein
LAGAPDGKTLYYVRAGEVWSTPVSETSAEKPHRIRTGIAVTVEPGGQYLVILLVEAESTRLIRYTLPNGPEQPIPINGDLRPILGSNRLGPQAVASDGRIVVSLASKSAWNWPAAILNPRTGEAGIIPPGFELDMVAAGWDFSGRVVVDGTSNRSSLWRFRPVKRQN